MCEEACAACAAQNQDSGALISDCTLPDHYLCLPFARDLELLGPWGKDYEEPKFDGVFRIDALNILKNRHLKVKLRTANNYVVDGIKFRANAAERALTSDLTVRVVYTINVDRYFPQERLQLNIEAIEPI